MHRGLFSRLFNVLAGLIIIGYGWKIWKTGLTYNKATTGGGIIATHAGVYAKPLAVIIIVIGLYMLWIAIKSFYKKN